MVKTLREIVDDIEKLVVFAHLYGNEHDIDHANRVEDWLATQR